SGTNEFYLMTPMMSTTGQSSLQLSFKHSINDFNGNYTMRVVAIADGVEYIIEEWLDPSLLPDMTPMDMSYVLTAAHGVGAADFQLAWVFDGNSFNINQWYIDDVMLNGSRAKSGRSFVTNKVFLDGQLVAETTDDEHQFDVATLTPYETYTAGVAAVYSTGQSPTAEFDFIYVPCGDYDAPTAFAAAQVEGTLNVMLEWTNVDAAALDTVFALRIYRNGEEYVELDFEDAVVDTYLDANLEFGMYTYCITYIYDSGAETCQGLTCSDEIEIDGNAGVNGMVMQAAYLGGNPIAGASVMLVSVDDPDVSFEFFTDATGAYEGMVIAGTYDYTVSANGY
ncbi:MAG: carboxypeptidase-like regulatory domain-containing protein, partial [Bacteroidales bacterium]|nr:carboxypeptidase-like regulatory domain-containing protein [Bacteroidales bacterium]